MVEINTRTQIIKAAEIRFTQYGYGKTTMAEIAKDCGMSAANLYRHYKNKLAIGSAMAELYFNEEYTQLKKIIGQQDLSSAIKLQTFTLHALNHCHNYFTNSPRIIELVEVMSVQSPEVCDNHQQKKIALLEELLRQGKDQSEFLIDDFAESAIAIHMATSIFHMPMMMPIYTLEELEGRAKTLCRIIVCGLQQEQKSI